MYKGGDEDMQTRLLPVICRQIGSKLVPIRTISLQSHPLTRGYNLPPVGQLHSLGIWFDDRKRRRDLNARIGLSAAFTRMCDRNDSFIRLFGRIWRIYHDWNLDTSGRRFWYVLLDKDNKARLGFAQGRIIILTRFRNTQGPLGKEPRSGGSGIKTSGLHEML